MALVRVYCGLVSAYPPRQLAVGSSSLYVTTVDDAGRILDVCEIGDDSYGYAYLSALLAERATGPYSVAIATNGGQRLVPMLLAAAGWALAVVDDDATDDYTDRFADEFHDDTRSGPTRRRALGLARALQGGALSAALTPAPAELAELKPVLSALGALATGRQASSVALREVLRELYPAALRAYPDPADPVALAVMDALPEPGTLGFSPTGRGRDAAAAVDAVAARLASTGLADQSAITEAITALRVAIAETPRRSAINRTLTATVAETVRQAVAAVRAYDAASTALVNALAERVAPAGRHAATNAAAPVSAPSRINAATTANAATPASAPPPVSAPVSAAPRSRTAIPRAARAPVSASAGAAPAAAPPSRPSTLSSHSSAPPSSRPSTPSTRSSAPPSRPSAPPSHSSAPPPLEPAAPPAAAASSLPPRRAGSTPARYPMSSPPGQPAASPPLPPRPMSSPPPAPQPMTPPPVAPAPVMPPPPLSAPTPASGAPHNRPVSPPPPPPPGITPIAEPRTPLHTRSRRHGDDQVRVPISRPTLDGPPQGSRAGWPTSAPSNDWAAPPPNYGGEEPLPSRGTREREPLSRGAQETPLNRGTQETPLNRGTQETPLNRGTQETPLSRGRREPSHVNGTAPTSVTPPWRADDLKPPEPPALRLVEPTLPEELRDDLGYPSYSDSRPLRLVEPSHNGIPRSAPPVSADDDSSLLIFEQTRSAWFTQDDDEASWSSVMDIGWQAAELAARPTVGDRTDAGLPRRVPHANLVPGAPPRRDDRPLRVVRDPASIAEHTSGYFSGWRRGQEVGGYPLGGQQRRPSGGAWEFHRDEDRMSG